MIKVENLSKHYRIKSGSKQDTAHSYSTLRDSMANGIKSLLSWKNKTASEWEEFWAVRDVSFEVKQGEVVGLIGRNGAGKSTLLKLLSRITEPSSGRITLDGKVGSLLEVGTGFHPELSGRENIFLNGAILGMKRTEIQAKFDEIVDFAGVEKFLETPVKRYSSGMYVRLAFSVAAHLETEILLVDEVLAVGDSQFQKKCLQKMENVSSSGRTVIFVSHNMSTILSLCSRCIFLKNGQLDFDSEPREAVRKYLEEAQPTTHFQRTLQRSGDPTITEGRLQTNEKEGSYQIDIKVTIESDSDIKSCINVSTRDSMAQQVGFSSIGSFNNEEMLNIKKGKNTFCFRMDGSNLAVGSYFLSLSLSITNVRYLDRCEDCFSFDIEKSPRTGTHRVFSQNWGLGSVELPMSKIDQPGTET
ncbi:MAG: ATP-binding cassette domain-containing protein [Opitutae bacterium]|nr:ATP-binding cassette domain-containing protein [Opitutae bacterium]